MPHVLEIDGKRTTHTGEHVDVVDTAGALVARALRLDDGDLVLVTAGPAARDGLPALGRLVRVAWGAGALVRTGRTRIAVRWEGGAQRRSAPAGASCRLCVGALGDERVVACDCEAFYHETCHELADDCVACGRPVG